MGIGLTQKRNNQLNNEQSANYYWELEISYECRTPILVEESSQIRQLIQMWYNGDEFKSICWKYSQSLEKIVTQYGKRFL